jgi:hypothetical protein
LIQKSIITSHFCFRDQNSATEQLYIAKCCNSSLPSVLSGTNSIILAYGQSNSGKSHTLFGHLGTKRSESPAHISESSQGLCGLFLRDLCAAIAKSPNLISVEISFFQVSGKFYVDLLESVNRKRRVHNSIASEVETKHLSRHPLESLSAVLNLV